MVNFLRATIAFACLSSVTQADLVTLDFTDSGAAGQAFAMGNTFTVNGITITMSVTGAGGSVSFSTGGIQGGVDDGSGVADRIEADETITLAFSEAVSLTALDLNLVGPSADDGALISLDGAPDITLETGVANFNGSTDIWTPAPVAFTTIRIAAEAQIGLQGLSFVPEPGALSLVMIPTMCFLTRRRRRRNLPTT